MCKQFYSTNSCGKCKYSIFDDTLVYKLNIVQITQLCVKLLWMEEILEVPSKSSLISSSLVKCNKSIIIDKDKIQDIAPGEVVYTILCKWIKRNTSNEGSLAFHIVSDASETLKKIESVLILRNEMLKLSKYVSQLTHCNGKCSVVTINKDAGICSFSLNKAIGSNLCDMRTVIHIMTNVVVNVHMIKTKYTGLGMYHISIDPDKVIVHCDGGLHIGKGYTSTTSTIRDIKKVCTNLLDNWCRKGTKDNDERSTIQGLCLLCEEAEDLEEIVSIFNNFNNNF